MHEKIPLDQLRRRRTDHHRIGRSVSLEPGGNIGCVPQRQVFLAPSSTDLTHNHHARMNAHPHGQTEPFVLLQTGIQGAERLDHA
jgi:hypothetical protein